MFTGKASNAGGVACSGFEMAQNSTKVKWTREEVDQRLKQVYFEFFEGRKAVFL